MEPTQYICAFCSEPISGEVIHPCQCEKYYHLGCMGHVVIMNRDPLSIQKCEECQTNYQTKYKNRYDYYVYRYFTFQSKYFYYLYALSGLIGIICSLVDQGFNSFFFGLAIGSLAYAICLWISISLAYLLYRLQGPVLPVAASFLNIMLIVINLNYPNTWLDCSVLAIVSALLVKSKKYLFVLSSNYPYLIIKNHVIGHTVVSV